MDVNEKATSRWIKATDGFDRVRSVLRQTREPTPVTQIAEQAHVSETSARKHLDRLAELGPAATTQDGRTTLYHRNEEHHIFQRIRQLQREHTRAELFDGIREMKSQLQNYREQHSVESPEEIALDIDDRDEPWHVISEWESTRQNLALAQTALSYGQARELIEA
jgi:DNA-binding transcriptional regulator GbsR (MarR family)